jgi:ketosteroid isomerase-like protein
MRSMLSMFAVLLVSSAFSLFAQNDNVSEMRLNLEKWTDKFVKANLDGDYKTIANFYSDDAVSLPSYEPMWRGKNAILEGNKKDFESGMKFNSFKVKSLDLFGSGDLVYEIGTFEVNFNLPNMTSAMNDHGKYLNVWQKQNDGSWKLKADTWNSDVNPMSMNQAGAKYKDDNEK